MSIVAGSYDGLPAPVDGLVRESAYLWGLVRTEGDTPDIVSLMRRLAPAPSWPPRLLRQSNRGAPGIRAWPSGRLAAKSMTVAQESPHPDLAFSAAPIDGAESFALRIAGNIVRWSEGAIADLTGTEVAPGLQWALPAAHGNEGMHYASRIFEVRGHIQDHAVRGFMGCDEVHLSPGRKNYVDDPITAGHLSDAWCTWATAYEDGCVEAGHAAFGRDGFAFGLRARDGVAHSAAAVSGTVDVDAQGFPQRIVYDIDGEAWEFIADERGFPVEPLPGPVRQAEGLMRRVGESRRPVAWCATPEVPAPPGPARRDPPVGL